MNEILEQVANLIEEEGVDYCVTVFYDSYDLPAYNIDEEKLAEFIIKIYPKLQEIFEK